MYLSKLNAKETQYKIQELLLNRIENLKWFYFELDLNNSFKEGKIPNPDEIETFFKKIIEIPGSPTGALKYDGVISKAKVLEVLFYIIKRSPEVLTNVLKRLFDINEISSESTADEGKLGKFNKKDKEYRDKLFKEKVGPLRNQKDGIVVLAEGDSWFQFPRVYLKIDPVKDIIDWLIDDPKYAVKSLAAGGDWLSNIFYSGEYIEELPKISPDVFLISGGGNDLVGNNRIAIMVKNPLMEKVRTKRSDDIFKELCEKRKHDKDIDQRKYERGLSLLSDEFFCFLNLYFVQYFVFLYTLSHVKKFKKMMIITQGYDYTLPYNKNRGFFLSVQRIINEFLDTGHWLYEPLTIKGIAKKYDQEAVMYAMIYEFNEMLIQLANFKGLPNVFHIDCRGFADESDWFDELHLKSKSYKEITKVYKLCMTENFRMEKPPKRKVYKVTDLLP